MSWQDGSATQFCLLCSTFVATTAVLRNMYLSTLLDVSYSTLFWGKVARFTRDRSVEKAFIN